MAANISLKAAAEESWTPDPNDSAALFSALTLNSLLYCITRRHTPDFLRPYVPVLGIHSAVDIFCNLVLFLIGPRVYPFNNRLNYIFRGVWRAGSPQELMHQIIIYLSFAVYLPIVMISLDVVFRWILVCHKYQMTNRQLIVFAVCALIYSVFFGYPSYLAITRTDPNQFSREEIESVRTMMGMDSLPPMGIIYVPAPLPIMVFALYNAVIFVEMGFICGIGRQIRTAVESEWIPNLENNRILSRLLIAQTLIPLITCVPTYSLVASTMLRIDSPLLGAASTPILLWLATLRPVATILLIPNYRAAILGLFSKPSAVAGSGGNCQTGISA